MEKFFEVRLQNGMKQMYKNCEKKYYERLQKGYKKMEVVYSRIFCFFRLKMMIKKANSSKCARLDDVFDL